ncbi:pyruvate kinase [Patescibacteria group bacterium]
MIKTRTKIVCTIGPSSWEKMAIKKLAESGMNVIRMNMAHGTYDEHARTIKRIREVEREVGRPLAIEVDLQGPKIRVGEIAGDGIELKPGQEMVFSTNPKLVKKATKDLAKDKVFVQYPNLHQDVEPGASLLLADGTMGVKVLNVDGQDIVCKIITGGILKSHKGLNFPDTTISIPTITDKDKKDLAFAIKHDVEWVGLSFVRAAEDILELRELIDRASHGKQPAIKITAKIETHEAIENLEEIVKVSDGIVVARGDLGPEVSVSAVPELQKLINQTSRSYLKPAIVATQMLYSMVENPRPTRAEVSDVANAVFDHMDAIYLSDETASGKYPVEAVKMAVSIIRDAENSEYDDALPFGKLSIQAEDKPLVMLARHAASLAKEIDAQAIVVTTVTGQTAIAVSSARQEVPIIAVTDHKKVQRQLNLVWGIDPMVHASIVNINTVTKDIREILQKSYHVKAGDKIVFIDGVKKDKTEGENLVEIITL